MVDKNIEGLLSKTLDLSNCKPSEEIEIIRNGIYGYDKSILNCKGDFHQNSGLCVFEINGIPYSCVFIKGSSKSLHVGFSGAKMPNHDYFANPGISRWSYHKFYDGCFLGIDDPMYYSYPQLSLGWYYGKDDYPYIRGAIKLVDNVIKLNNIERKNVIFFSSSGGGYAAFMAALMYPDTLSISLNPQIFISNWNYSPTFEKITGINLDKPDRYYRNDPLELLKRSQSRHVILFNAASEEDVERQLKPLVQRLGINLRYGLNVCGPLLLWLYDCPGAPDAHTAFETRSIYGLVEKVAIDFKENAEFNIEKNQSIAIFVNELWHDLYEEKQKAYALKNQWEENEKLFLNQIRCFKNSLVRHIK